MIVSPTDRALSESLTHRLNKQSTILSNIANSQTPGYRALGYDFEDQLQKSLGRHGDLALKVSQSRHAGVSNPSQGDVYVKPTESIGQDGNTVDIDVEMSEMAENQILYKATVEALNRRLGILRYSIGK
jgi:flagellar basal-body rod protein FlgB